MNANVILVPLDGSALSQAALPFAEAMANAEHCRLRLFSVVETALEGLFPESVKLNAALSKVRGEAAIKSLDGLAGELRSRGLEVETETTYGAPAAEVLLAGGREDIAAIVMATHGRGGADRWVLGSVADKVMRGSSKPVLLVRAKTAGTPHPDAHLRRLLVPLDGSSMAEEALEPATQLALATGATLVLIRVVPYLTSLMNWGPSYVPELLEVEAEMAADAHDALADARSRLPKDVHAEIVVLRGPPAIVLEDYVHGHAIDLTIMTTHGRGGVSRFVLGSTADRLVQAGAPVLLVHAEQHGTERQETDAARPAAAR